MATAVSRRSRSHVGDPFDTTPVDNPAAEKACLAAMLDLIDREPEAVRQIADELAANMFTIEAGGTIFTAICQAITTHDRPTHADVAGELRRLHELDSGDEQYTASIQALTDFLQDRVSTGPQAARLAAAAALEVMQAAGLRAAILASADVVASAKDRRLSADELRRLADRIGRVEAMMERRQAKSRRLRVRVASEISPRPIEWFWPKRISAGSLTIITGMPGLSKSLLTIDIAARITNGSRWPDGSGSAPEGGVLLFGTEDDPEKVVVPRLMAAGADRSLVRIVDGAEEGKKDWLGAVSIDRDLTLVREQLDTFPECRAIVFDPLTQFMDCEENSNAQTRAALAPLVNLAQERNVAVIAVMHLNKKTDSAMIQRIAGAGSYGQMARHILWVANDPDDPATGLDKRRAMIVVKNSYGATNCGQLYRVTTRAGEIPGIEWVAGTVEMDAERLNPKPGGVSQAQQDRRSDAVDFLREFLAGGPQPAEQVKAAMEANDFSRRQLDHAKRELGIKPRQTDRGWVWALPVGDPPSDDELGTFELDQWPPTAPGAAHSDDDRQGDPAGDRRPDTACGDGRHTWCTKRVGCVEYDECRQCGEKTHSRVVEGAKQKTRSP